MNKYIIKEDGDKEIFDSQKFYRSLIHAGTDQKVASYILGLVEERLEKVSKSRDVYTITLKQLRKKQPEAAMKYTLKKAIMGMGPTGFPFEKYIACLLREFGYNTEVGTMVKGACVEHEIDVIAHKNDEHAMIECKYHNNPGSKSDIQTALYIYARFLDLKEANHRNIHNCNFTKVCLATNTKCTNEAIKYAGCVNMQIIAWNYPKDRNLEYYIESKKLYPVSILTGLKKTHKQTLFENNIMTIQDFLQNSPQSIEKLLSVGKKTSDRLFTRAAMLLV